MIVIERHITLTLSLIFTVCSESLFQTNEVFKDTFCENRMIPRGIKRSLMECASLCSLTNLCTGFFFDDEKNCFVAEEQLSDVNTCSFREGRYYTKLGGSF